MTTALATLERPALAGPAPSDDAPLIAALRAGDEAAFVELLDRYHAALVRVAAAYVPDRAAAEDVAQETWLAVLRGIDRFEGRSSLRTWIFAILANQARRRGQREGRCVPFSALASADLEPGEAAVEPERFFPAGTPLAHHWVTPPADRGESAEDRLLARETRGRIEAAIETLPPVQRSVITLRDVLGWGAAETCNVLGLSETNQRVLLHRARSKVRRALERYLEGA